MRKSRKSKSSWKWLIFVTVGAFAFEHGHFPFVGRVGNEVNMRRTLMPLPSLYRLSLPSPFISRAHKQRRKTLTAIILLVIRLTIIVRHGKRDIM